MLPYSNNSDQSAKRRRVKGQCPLRGLGQSPNRSPDVVLTRREAAQMTIKAMLEQRERDTLSPFATLSSESRGRERPVTTDDMRTEFQRDRDRILHCKSFRRLKGKTQVFLSPQEIDAQ